MPFEFFDHTGDIGVRLHADSVEGLFEAAADAFTEILTDLTGIQPVQQASVELEAPQLDLLLVDWLSELLYRFDARHELVRSVHVAIMTKENAVRLTATLAGEPMDDARHPIKVLVKAVTYHALEVVQTDDGWRGTVVFDI